VSLRLQAHGVVGMSNYLSQPHLSYTEINPAKYNLLDIKQGGQQTYQLEIVIASHTAAVVSWLNIPVNYSPSTKTASSLIPLSQMHHCKLEGLTKAFTAMVKSLQMNDPFSVKVCHFD